MTTMHLPFGNSVADQDLGAREGGGAPRGMWGALENNFGKRIICGASGLKIRGIWVTQATPLDPPLQVSVWD